MQQDFKTLLKSTHPPMKHLWTPWRMAYIENAGKENGCVFCKAQAQKDSPENLIVQRGKLAFVILNLYPYTSGHVMVVPFTHKPNLHEYFSVTWSYKISKRILKGQLTKPISKCFY